MLVGTTTLNPAARDAVCLGPSSRFFICPSRSFLCPLRFFLCPLRFFLCPLRFFLCQSLGLFRPITFILCLAPFPFRRRLALLSYFSSLFSSSPVFLYFC